MSFPPRPPIAGIQVHKPDSNTSMSNTSMVQTSSGPLVTVFVGNISEKWPGAMIRQLLGTCGQVVTWKRVQGASGKLQGFGFCEFNGPDAGLRAVRLLHGLEVGDQKLVVKVDGKTSPTVLEEYKAERKLKIRSHVDSDSKESDDGKTVDYMDDEMKEADDRSRVRIGIIFREFKNQIDSYIPPGSEKSDLHETKEEIENIFLNPEKNDTHFILSCTSIRVGSYFRVHDGDSRKVDECKAKICDLGILFHMAHSVSPSKTVQLVIPKSLIIGCQAYFSIRSSSFIVLRVGNKIAQWIKDKLGLTEENKAKSWFDPLYGAPSERNIVLVTDLCSDSQMALLRKIYGKTLTELDYQQAAVFRKDIELELYSDKTGNEVLTRGTTVAVVAKPTTGHIKSSTKVTPPKPFIASLAEQNKPVVVTKTLSHVPCGSFARVNNSDGQNPTTNKPTVITPISVPKSDHTHHHYKDGTKAVITWPKGQGGMTLLQRDIRTLMPGQFLNDEIMDFWLSYVLNKLLKKEDKERTHLFSVHFYSRLTQVPKMGSCPAFEMDKNLSAADKRHRRVKKWTKNVDIFKKDFIIIPIIDNNCHWYVAIICFPGLSGPHWVSDGKSIPDWTNVLKVNNLPTYQPPPGMQVRDEAEEDADDVYLLEQYYSRDLGSNIASILKSNGLDQNDTETQLEEMKVTLGAANVTEEPMDVDVELDNIQSPDVKPTDFRVHQPCILLFDPLSGSSRSRVFPTLREYLQQEYKEKIGKERSFSNVDMPGFMPNVPQQKNGSDGGIYALQYVEHFFSHPFPTFCLPITDLQKWFPELKNKRKEIYETIYELVKTENPETLNWMPKFIEAPVTTTTCTSTSTSTPSTSTPAASASIRPPRAQVWVK